MTTIFIKDLIGQDILNRISAQDILDLIKLVQMRVMDEFGVELETEVRIIG